jgi:hypothetical protein
MMPKIMCPIRLTGQTIVLGNCWCHLLSEQSGKKEFNNNVLNMLNIKLIDENLLCCTWNINTMDEEIPKGFLLFESNFDFSQACAFCADFELDVLELHVNGFDTLVFFYIWWLSRMCFILWNMRLFYCEIQWKLGRY